MFGFDFVAAIATEWSQISVQTIGGSLLYLAASGGAQVLTHRFWFGKRLGTAPIIQTSSRLRPFVNAFVSPVCQALVCLKAFDQGHYTVALLVGIAAALDVLFTFRRIQRYQREVVVMDKAIIACGDYLKFEKSDSSCLDGEVLHYEKGKRKIRVRLTPQLRERLDLTVLPPGVVHENPVNPDHKEAPKSPLPLRRILS